MQLPQKIMVPSESVNILFVYVCLVFLVYLGEEEVWQLVFSHVGDERYCLLKNIILLIMAIVEGPFSFNFIHRIDIYVSAAGICIRY